MENQQAVGIGCVGDLELGQDLTFQRRSWLVQRVAWAGMVLLVIAAVLGVFGGDGVINQAALGMHGDALYVQYHHFDRVLDQTHLRLELGGEARLWIVNTFLEYIRIEKITPEPEQTIAGDGRTLFVFRVAPGDQAGMVTIFYKPQRIGSITGQIGLENGISYEFQQFIYP